ncbi:MAG: hypothetical protein OXC60_09845 [Litoreibacter sp.]|nr:hypothetical protein [Litoreibacter sp.]MCY4334960.1 hypothetical protein [Litoreibacter sp.]
MVSLFAAVWLIPALWGAVSGYWRGGRPALNVTDFAKDIGIAALTAAVPIYMFHMVWAGAFMNVTGGYNALGSWASYWTALTALIWFPLMVIAYIIRATRIKNADR